MVDKTIDEINARRDQGFDEDWAIIWLARLDTVYRSDGKCACDPSSECPCPEMYEKRECKCRMIFRPEEMADNKYAKKRGITVEDDGDFVIIRMPKIKKE